MRLVWKAIIRKRNSWYQMPFSNHHSFCNCQLLRYHWSTWRKYSSLHTQELPLSDLAHHSMGQRLLRGNLRGTINRTFQLLFLPGRIPRTIKKTVSSESYNPQRKALKLEKVVSSKHQTFLWSMCRASCHHLPRCLQSSDKATTGGFPCWSYPLRDRKTLLEWTQESSFCHWTWP